MYKNNTENFLLTRRRRILKIVALTVTTVSGLSLLLTVNGLFSQVLPKHQPLTTSLTSIFTSSLGVLVGLTAFVLARLGRARPIQLGSYIVTGIMALLIFVSLLFTSYNSTTILAFLLPMMCAGLLFSAKEVLGWLGGLLGLHTLALFLGGEGVFSNSQRGISGDDITAYVTYFIALLLVGGGLWYLQVNVGAVLEELNARIMELARVSDDREQKRQLGLEVGQNVRHRAIELSQVSTQQQSGANEQVSAVSEVAQTMEQLSSSAGYVAESSNRAMEVANRTRSSAANVKATAEQAAETTQKGLEVTAQATTAIVGVQQQITDLERQLQELVNQSSHIETIVNLIRNVANETHLLALNAAIESAGAGEAGARFGVVADEVKRLADHSLQASRDIQQTLSQIQNSIKTSSEVVAQTRQDSEAAAAQAREAGTVIMELGRVIQVNSGLANEILNEALDVSNLLGEIAQLTNRQRTASDQITQSLRSIDEIARDNAATTRQLNETASQLEVLSHELTVALDEQKATPELSLAA